MSGYRVSRYRARWGAVVLVVATSVGLAGCSTGLTEAIGDAESCRAAASVTAASAADAAAVAIALEAFAAVAPGELQAPLAVLSQDGDAGVAEQQAATTAVKTWVAEHCGTRLSFGTATPMTAHDAQLDDAQVIVGTDESGVTVAVVGIADLDVAVALCEQAVEAHADADGTVSVRVFSPEALLLASNDDGECALMPGFG